MQLAYDVVVATRNRPDILKLSLELLSKQTRQAKNVIIVDASDDPEPVRQIVQNLTTNWDSLTLLSNQRRGLTRQRNIGLDLCTSEIVVFPDDDSLLFDDVMHHVMETYERDREGRIGGVCSAEATVSPVSLTTIEQTTYRLNAAHRLQKRVARYRYACEHWLFPDPLHTVGKKLQSQIPVPDFVVWPDYAVVPAMTGFRMSFRTAVIRERRFNEVLRDYCLYEDVDACFAVAKSHLLVGARRAQIYHHKAPEPRAKGFEMGLVQVINRVYVIGRRTEFNTLLRWRLFKFFCYKFLLYLAGAMRSDYGKDVLRGYIHGLKSYGQLIKSDKHRIDDCYSALLSAIETPVADSNSISRK
jgi:glycosyltransferase involved in cell wall biosynthesis